MNHAQTSNNQVESTVSAETAKVLPLFQFVVTNENIEDDSLSTNSWDAVVDYLLEDPKVIKEGRSYYGRTRSTRWDDEACMIFIKENIEDIAYWCSYRIQKNSELQTSPR